MRTRTVWYAMIWYDMYSMPAIQFNSILEAGGEGRLGGGGAGGQVRVRRRKDRWIPLHAPSVNGA